HLPTRNKAAPTRVRARAAFVDATLPNSHWARSVGPGPLRLLVRLVLVGLVGVVRRLDVGLVTAVVFIAVAPAVVLDVGLLPDGKVIHNRMDHFNPLLAGAIVDAVLLGKQGPVVLAAGLD